MFLELKVLVGFQAGDREETAVRIRLGPMMSLDFFFESYFGVRV